VRSTSMRNRFDDKYACSIPEKNPEPTMDEMNNIK